MRKLHTNKPLWLKINNYWSEICPKSSKDTITYGQLFYLFLVKNWSFLITFLALLGWWRFSLTENKSFNWRIYMWPTPTKPGTSAFFLELSYWFYQKVQTSIAIIWHQNHDSVYHISGDMTFCDPNHSIFWQKFNVRK